MALLGGRTQATSASDRLDYRRACLAAATDEIAFGSFRRDPAYQLVLEHFSPDDGVRYLEEIRRAHPWVLARMQMLVENDAVGGATLFEYEGLPPVSPATLRYAKQLGDLLTLFGALDGKSLVEIGGGYGGLCRMVLAAFPSARYTLVDLPEPLALADRYLGCFGEEIRGSVRLLGFNELPAKLDADLVVSIAAFSECVPAVQDRYLSGIINCARSGFLLCNRKPEAYPRAVIVEKLSEFHRGGLGAIEEVPLTARGNIVLVWGAQPGSDLRPLPYPFQRALYRAWPALFLRGNEAYRTLRRHLRPVRRWARETWA